MQFGLNDHFKKFIQRTNTKELKHLRFDNFNTFFKNLII